MTLFINGLNRRTKNDNDDSSNTNISIYTVSDWLVCGEYNWMNEITKELAAELSKELYKYELKERNIEVCPHCDQWFPLVILTCGKCCKQIGTARGFHIDTPYMQLCFECHAKLDEMAWKYEELCK